MLNLTQATVSYRLKILEQEMGSILVERGKGIQKPFFVDESVLIRPVAFETSELEPIHPTDLNCKNEIYWNWGPSFQLWHDRWWDPIRASYIPVDIAGLIFSLMHDSRQWSVVPKSVAKTFVKSGQFVIQ